MDKYKLWVAFKICLSINKFHQKVKTIEELICLLTIVCASKSLVCQT